MPGRQAVRTSRRRFLATSVATSLSLLPGRWVSCGERPPVRSRRATSGDRIEPDWEERLTVTVGPKQADIVGKSSQAIQAAVDYVARLGGGTVKILPGTYKLRNAVYLQTGVRIQGAGADTVLVKEPSITTKLAQDSDWYDQEITLTDARGFQVGDGVCLKTKNPHNGGIDIAKRTLVARSGNRFKLDRALRQNFWLMGDSTVSTLFPILSGEEIEDFAIEDLALDGNKANNELLDGNHAGCIFLQDCRDVSIRGVEARHYNGDGISWQICHDVVVKNCHSHDNENLGLHPGSGSQRPVMVNNRLERNDIGIFFCWGVKHGLAEGNKVLENRGSGISIGHRDTDNWIKNNEIVGSGKVGILFRPERGKDFAPHRNRLENNRVVDSGAEDGVAIDIQGTTESIDLAKNEIKETRAPGTRIGVRIGAETKDIRLDQNQVEGFAIAVEDMRKV